MASTTLPAMKTSPKYIFFTDFDGTITTRDSNDFLTDNVGYGAEKRKQGNQDTLHGRLSFRESFQGMMDSVSKPYNECIKYLLENIKLDPGFKEFHSYAKKENIPIVVLSSGMQQIIHALLRHLIGEEADDIQIVSNHAAPRKEGLEKWEDVEGGWKIVFHDDTHFGHDKSIEIRQYHKLPDNERPTMFYAGDGVSDLSAAKETDLLFAKKGQDLVKYCIKEKVPFTEFEDWTTITSTVKDIVDGKTDVKTVAKLGKEEAETEK